MERLDQRYINELVERAEKGESNAFAELFMSVCDRVYVYLFFMLENEDEAKKALKDVFTEAKRSFSYLSDPGLFIPWILRISFRWACDRGYMDHPDSVLSRFLFLPIAESQILIMHIIQGLTVKETAELLNYLPHTVKRFVRLANRHLGRDENQGVNDQNSRLNLKRNASLGPENAARTLRAVFDELGEDPNTVPLEALSSYTVYRRERFSIQRGILVVTMIIFMLMPLMFLVPHYEVTYEVKGERGLPVYTIRLDSVLPPSKVTATLLKHSLPVYEAGSREFTVEPTRNGVMKIDVELVNRQFTLTEYDVKDVDSKGPELIGNVTEEDSFIIQVRDSGIGVDYKEIYAIGDSGAVYYPINAGDDGIVFVYPEENWDIYIPDHIGNTLHLSLKLKDREEAG